MSNMIRKESPLDRNDIWTALAAPLPSGVVQWRQQGKPRAQGSGYVAPFVAYIEANTVRERLDAVVPGEWDLTLDLMPPLLSVGGDGDANDTPVAYKARLQVLGVIREDVGAGKDYKQASTDAFKRVAVRFGIGHELYSDYEITWVKVESDSKYAKPLEDPAVAFARKRGKPAPVTTTRTQDALAAVPKPPVKLTKQEVEDALDMEPTLNDNGTVVTDENGDPVPASALAQDEQSCPKCGGRMWDNRLTKRNPRAPDFKCRDRACDGVLWPPREQKAAKQAPEETEEIPF